MSFSGATSTDPDPGDALNMVWTVNGVNAGTGATLNYTFANDGLYVVGLTVTDNSNAENVTSVNVSVQNVAPAISQFAGATLLRGETYNATGSFTDPGADSWAGTVNFGDGPATPSIQLTNKSFTLSHTYTSSGSFTVTVSISDGTVTSTRTATVGVMSATEGIDDLSTAVAELPLNKGQLNSLQVKLQNATKHLEAGNSTPAVNVLGAFINEMQATMQSGRVSEAAGSSIVAYAERVIASITAP